MTHADRDGSEGRTLGGCMWCDAESCDHGARLVSRSEQCELNAYLAADKAEPEASEKGSLVWSIDGRACPTCREPNVHHAGCPQASETAGDA